jgi:ABC-type Zn uptake system ZnuABC Zn-binding protein ZnuA
MPRLPGEGSVKVAAWLSLVWLVLAACASGQPAGLASVDNLVPAEAQGNLRIVTSTTLVADVVRQVGGPDIVVMSLLPPLADVHNVQLTPPQLVAVQEADLVMVNGLELEDTFLPDLLAAARGPVVSISEGIAPRSLAEADQGSGQEPSNEALHAQAEDEPDGGRAHAVDPHVWMDPQLVKRWAATAGQALAALDPAHAAAYQQRTSSFEQELSDLDAWIMDLVAAIPPANRLLVTDHEALGYFADRYGFEIVGGVVPAFSSLAEPSAGQLADLQTRISERGVRAIFIAIGTNRSLAERVSQDLGVPLVSLYMGTLSEAGGPAPTYLAMMEHDVRAIVEALQ